MDGDALFRAILAAPDDDTVRLAYADWLAENGREERAAFIRVQIELARLAKDDPLREELIAREGKLFEVLHPDQLRGELPPELHRYGVQYVGHYRRGFFAVVYLPAYSPRWNEFRAHGPLLFAHAPVEELWLEPTIEITANEWHQYGERFSARHIQELAVLPGLARLAKLHIASPVTDIDDLCREVLASPPLRSLRGLHFRNTFLPEYALGPHAPPHAVILGDPIAPETQAALRAAFGDRVSWTM